MNKPFQPGECAWTVIDGEAELVVVVENHGPAVHNGRDQITVEHVVGGAAKLISSRNLDREHPKARAAAMVRYAAGR